MDDQSLTAVADGLRAGNPRAWQSVHDLFAQRVWRLVARWLGASSADVADVVQETFLAAARSARGFDPNKGTLWWWLCGIARNQTALHCRKTARRRQVVGEFDSIDVAEPEMDWDANPLEAASLLEQAQVVRAVLLELPDEYAMLLTAKYLDGVEVEQLASDSRTSEVAVRSKLARARQAFRCEFERQVRSPESLSVCKS